MKRLGIYAFYDPKGIVDDYVFYFLQSLKIHTQKIIVVVNGNILPEYTSKLSGLGYLVVVRENSGFDACAYRQAIFSCSDLSSYDELILCNNSFFGPVCPLADVFDEMEKREQQAIVNKGKNLDFWGMTIHKSSEDCILGHKISEHVQSFFIVLKRKVFISEAFKNFFENLNPPKTFAEAVLFFEIAFTKQLSMAGFNYDAFIKKDKYPNLNVTNIYPFTLIKNDHLPLVKRKVFIEDFKNFINIGRGNESRKLIDYIKSENLYDTNLIWQHLLRTQKFSLLALNLHLNYIVSSRYVNNVNILEKLKDNNKKCALIIYIENQSSVSQCLNYAQYLNDVFDIYIVSDSQLILDECKSVSIEKHLSINKFITIQNKVGAVSSYLIECRDIFFDYEYVCYFHDKPSVQLKNNLNYMDYFEHCMDSILPSREYALNVLNIFENEEKLGLLVPPPINWGTLFSSEHLLNTDSEVLMKKIFKELDIDLPFDKTPIAPYGDYFWCRTEALRILFNKQWQYSDFSDEPNLDGSTILRAIERAHPTIAQASGFFSAWINSESSEAIFSRNNYYYQRTFADVLIKICKLNDETGIISHDTIMFHIKDVYFKYKRKLLEDLKFKQKFYFLVNCFTMFRIGKFKHRLKHINKVLNYIQKSKDDI